MTVRTERRARSGRRAAGQLTGSVALTLALWSVPLGAQPATTAAALKAAFLYNFAKFAEWPADALAPGQHLELCVVGDNGVADALEQIIKRRIVDGHELAVQVIKADGAIRACHLLYVSSAEMKRFPRMLDMLAGASVFSVSDGDAFAKSGGVVQLMLEHERMRFAINVSAAQRARLHISANLLNLATIIKDQRDGS